MAWITPVDFTTGCLITAASWNQNVHANTKYLKGQAGVVTIEDRLDNQSQTLLIGVWRSGSATANNFLSRLDLESGCAGAPANAFSRYGGIYTQTGANGSPLTWGLTSASGINIALAPNAACLLLAGSSGDVTQGVIINQGATDNSILVFKSSDVGHGITDLVETDSYATMGKESSTLGGVRLDGYTEGALGVRILARVTNQDSTRSNAASSGTYVNMEVKNGTTTTQLSSNVNVFSVLSSGCVRFIFDSDGDFHADAAVTASSYDRFDDVAAVRALEIHRSPAVIARDAFDEWVNYSRRDLEAMKIATFNDQPGGDGSVFINYTALARLHSGAIWQMHKRLAELEALVKPKGPTLLARAQLWIGIRVRRWRFRRPREREWFRWESGRWLRRLR